MAAMTIKGKGPVARFVHEDGRRYTLRADGTVLRQFRYEDGSLSNATICGKYKRWDETSTADRVAAWRKYASARGKGTVTIL